MNLTVDRFGEFFAAFHDGHGPFRWQQRLLASLVGTGRWPRQIAAPTGSGKTAVIDVHVYALALMAAGAAPMVPRRLALVVDRRALVDDQYDHAHALASELERAGAGVVAEVAAALRSLSTGRDPSPLRVVRLRGGLPVPRGWRDDATGCVVLCATADMWGSRLLLRGYGSRPLARPREAGLLATDAVVVIDEAHLSRQLVTTARRVGELREVADEPVPVPGLQVVETTATPDSGTGEVAGVAPGDLAAEPLLDRRLTRPKPVELLTLPAWPLPEREEARRRGIGALAERAVALRQQAGPTVGCFANTVDTAAELATELARRGYRVEALCGRLRSFDLGQLRRRRPGLLTIKGNDRVDFVVSTQTLEVGSDLDWSALLTELAPGTALAQRAGRVNRRGNHTEAAVVVAVPEGGLTGKARHNTAPYHADDLDRALAWLHGRQADPRGLAPWALGDDPPPSQSRRRRLEQRPELADAWLWSRTTDGLAIEPDLDLWLSDDLEPDLDVGLVVRHDLPHDVADAARLLRAVPPRGYETFPVRLSTARAVLERHFPAGEAPELPPPLLVRRDEVFPYAHHDLRPADIIVIDDRVPAFAVLGDPAGDTAIVHLAGGGRAHDVLEGESHPRKGEVVLRLGSGSPLRSELATAVLTEIAASWDGATPKELRRMIADSLRPLASDPAAPSGQLAAACRLLRSPRVKHSDVILHRGPDGEPTRLIVVDARQTVRDEEARQQWTPAREPVLLDRHAGQVAARAGVIAERLGLGEPLTGLLARAGLHHDDGKADSRFQLALGREPDLPDHRQLRAKSGLTTVREERAAWARSGLPTRWRHEQLSVHTCWARLADLPDQDRQLVARLVGTSHGHGRHGFPHTAGELFGHLPDQLARELFDEGAWDELIERTHHRWGVWGCAYLEALLRAADGQVSAEGS
jgi:CRISPR-associated endonuclease/helicase Cas3